jgi:photosystem II stability/assembly factor-like uncharacterized protein
MQLQRSCCSTLRWLILFSLDVMRILFVSLFAAVCVGCATKSISPNDVFRFESPEEQRQLEKRALAGDTQAAQRLLDYYFFLQHDNRKALYWARVCASHGSADCAKSAKALREIVREQQQ